MVVMLRYGQCLEILFLIEKNKNKKEFPIIRTDELWCKMLHIAYIIGYNTSQY